MRLLVPLVALLLGSGGFVPPSEAKPASPREQIEELRAIRARMKGQEFLADPALASVPETASAPAPEPVQALGHTPAPPPSSKLGGEISLAEAQAHQAPAEQFTPNSSLFGGDKTNVRI